MQVVLFNLFTIPYSSFYGPPLGYFRTLQLNKIKTFKNAQNDFEILNQLKKCEYSDDIISPDVFNNTIKDKTKDLEDLDYHILRYSLNKEVGKTLFIKTYRGNLLEVNKLKYQDGFLFYSNSNYLSNKSPFYPKSQIEYVVEREKPLTGIGTFVIIAGAVTGMILGVKKAEGTGSSLGPGPGIVYMWLGLGFGAAGGFVLSLPFFEYHEDKVYKLP